MERLENRRVMLSLIKFSSHTNRFVGRITCALLLLVSPSLQAELLARDLGDDLSYARPEVLPGDLPPTGAEKRPLILDLRYSLAEAEAPTALNAWLNARASAKTPVFVLINSDTAPGLRDLLKDRTPGTGVLTIGRVSAETKPDIPVSTSDEEERRAYDAAKSGTIEALITENADKTRVDEATIMHARRNLQEEESFESNPLDRITPTEKKSEPSTRPPVDRALQRAVHLHRAMRALKLI